MERYVDVILPIPLDSCLTYLLPSELCAQAQVGCRAIVPLGKRKFYTAIIYRIHEQAPKGCQVKAVEMLLDPHPVIQASQLSLWSWISEYYLCSLGEVYNAALPSGMKLESETQVALEEDFQGDSTLSSSQERLINFLALDGKMSISKLSALMRSSNVLALVRTLMEKGAVRIQDEIMESYKPRTESMVTLSGQYQKADALRKVLDSLSRTKAQSAALLKYLDLAMYNEEEERTLKDVTRKELLLHASQASLKALLDKGILTGWKRQVERIAFMGKGLAGEETLKEANNLSQAQQKALDEIRAGFLKKDVCLLHGVTSSGKTELYIHLIKEAIQKGRQVLYLLPEIALTTHITERLRVFFGKDLGVYHSKFPDSWRVEVYNRQLSDHPFQIILGVRSSVLLPFKDLGLIIVDEEHETTYKQQDPAPRYHARDVAIILAHQFGAKVVLGSATPSLESYYNATEAGKYFLVRLTTRYKGLQLPLVTPVDTSECYRKRQMKGAFSPALKEAIQETLSSGEQAILFQNRRGFSPLVECHECGWVPKCHRCDVSLTYHKATGKLTCHYCGYTMDVPQICPSCKSEGSLKYKGIGTEKLEEEAAELFPKARILRLDLDTGRSRKAYEEILGAFQNHEADLLIGTQMISKGLDFSGVRTVGVVNADNLLNYPDFRALERAYQLMAQVSGRAGRKEGRGKVLLQTRTPLHPVILQVKDNDYEDMCQCQLSERMMFHYPPFYRLIAVYMKSHKENELEVFSRVFAQRLRQIFKDERILGPDRPAISRIKGLHIRKILVKIENTVSPSKAKKALRTLQERVLRDESLKSLQIYYDVDPY